jgi:alpha-L-fucosidase 2
LPRQWSGGSIRGLRARGGFIVDIAWSDGKLDKASIHSLLGTPCVVRCGDKTQTFPTQAGERYDIGPM